MSGSGDQPRGQGSESGGKGWFASAWDAFVEHTSRPVRIAIASTSAFLVSSAALLYGVGILTNDTPPSPLERPYVVTGCMEGGFVFVNGQPVFAEDYPELMGVCPSPAPEVASAGPETSADPGPAASERWLLTSRDDDGSKYSDLYTVQLAPEGSGPVQVLEDDTAVGTYEWTGDTVTIDFTRVLTMDDGYQFEDPWLFVCTRAPDGGSLTCECTTDKWSYSPDTGLDRNPGFVWPTKVTGAPG